MWPVIETVALPAIDVPTADRVRTEFGQFLDTPFDSPHCLIHNDLGPEHILVDETTGMPTGLIDFESAWIGDPAIDFVPLRALLGAHRLHALIEGRDLGGGLAERMRFYHWMGSVHAVIYGVREEHEDELRVAASELRKRLDVLP
jgi:aminoglycoside 2''-phosphotransferase